MLGGELAVLQGSPERSRRAPVFDGHAFDAGALGEDGFVPAGRSAIEAIAVPKMMSGQGDESAARAAAATDLRRE